MAYLMVYYKFQSFFLVLSIVNAGKTFLIADNKFFLNYPTLFCLDSVPSLL
jgi:hypothetical protein